MNTKVLILGLADVFISMIFTVFIIWITYKIVRRLVFKSGDADAGNLSMAILFSSILLSMGLLIQETANPIMNAFRLFLSMDLSYQAIFFKLLKVMAIYLGMSIIFGFFVNTVGILLFTSLTRNINEWRAIRENNVSVAIITAVIIIVLTLAIKDGMSLIFESWVPYPTTPRFY
jgi:ABC-type multidrug transport system fused ATPase/permease subunit